MPYLMMISTLSPYVPAGLKVLDEKPKELYLPITVDGELIGNQITGGVPIDPDLVPRRYSVDVPQAELPGFFELSVGYGVSRVVREKIEDLEPDVHQFLPIELAARDGRIPAGQHWLLHICNRVDALDRDQTDIPYDQARGRFEPWHLFGTKKYRLTVRSSPIEGKCLWMDRRIEGLPFCSDELFSFLNRDEITKLTSWRVDSV